MEPDRSLAQGLTSSLHRRRTVSVRLH
jgi:hypothetical protein